jgi:putative ubiquitin-RnfH superfamily antitoxin RatB of RatAB toxin-antitoxin module
LRVVVAFSPRPREVLEWALELPAASTVREAVAASGLAATAPQLDLGAASVGIWGRRCGWEQPLRDGDRVEIYRALSVDPKVARRERFRRQGARATGLFANQRPGAKPGY